jgi:glycosyltransferase involved in cell wall biosynthesis
MTRMRRAIRRIGPDVVQAYGYPADVIAGACAAGLRGVRVITTRRGNEVRPRRHLYYRLTNHIVDLVACVSEASARHSRDTEGLPPEKTVVIPNGIDLSRYGPRERPVTPIRSIGTVQRLRHVKGIDLLLDAYSSLPEDRPVLRIAGPADTSYGEEIVARYQNCPGVEFLGEVTNIPQFLAEIDLFVLPSRSEGMSNALLEALAMALPIVATDVGGNTEVLAGGEAGVLVEPTVEALAAGLQLLCQSPELAAGYARRARERAVAEYDVDVMIRRYEELYARLTETKR